MPVTLGPRYRVVTEIASGGMGTISLALRLEADGTKRPVAIKQLHAHLADDSDIVAYFVDEARIASRIVHPNVVRVEDVEMIGHDIVIVMQYVEGVSLSMLMKSLRKANESLPLGVARRIVHDALLGLHAAHELRDANGSPLDVVHRDVSPHNILLSVDGVALVGDFGIATAAGRVASTRTGGGVKGKLQYLSPEQIYRKPIDRRSDIFAAGIVLWECLTGRRLFSAGTEGETLAMVLREPIDPPSAHRADVPIELDEACLRALERDPSKRFETAEELARAIEASGPSSSRDEVAALVRRMAPAVIAARRSALDHALLDTSFDVSRARAERAPSTDGTPPRVLARTPLVAALLVGLVAGGVAVGFVARRSNAGAVTTSSSSASSAMVSSSPPTAPAAEGSVEAVSSAPPPPANHPAGTSAPRTTKKTSVKKPPGGRPFMPSDL